MNTVISLKSARGVISTKQQAVTVKVAYIYKLSDSTTPYQNLSIHDRLLAVAPPAPPPVRGGTVLTVTHGAPGPIVSPGCGSPRGSRPAWPRAAAPYAAPPSASPPARRAPRAPGRGAGERARRALRGCDKGRSRRDGARLPGASARAPAQRRWRAAWPPPQARAVGGAPRGPTLVRVRLRVGVGIRVGVRVGVGVRVRVGVRGRVRGRASRTAVQAAAPPY